MLQAVRDQSPKDPVIALAIAACHQEYDDHDSAIAELLRVGPDDFPEVAVELAGVYERTEKKDHALKVLQAAHKKHPTNKAIRYKYARIAGDLNLTPIAIYLLDELCREDPTSVDYFGYLGNACLDAELYDRALLSYRRAEANMGSDYSDQWIVSNIGNLINNKGLPTEACVYLERAISKGPQSEYAHNRLSGALKNKEAQDKEFHRKCVEGRRAVREAVAGPNSQETTK
jgi:predicted Zn-dependent protease